MYSWITVNDYIEIKTPAGSKIKGVTIILRTLINILHTLLGCSFGFVLRHTFDSTDGE